VLSREKRRSKRLSAKRPHVNCIERPMQFLQKHDRDRVGSEALVERLERLHAVLESACARLRGRGGALAPSSGVHREADRDDKDGPVEEKLDIEGRAKLLHA
jgi:hypothetical protein